MFSWKEYYVFGISLYYIIRILKSLSLSKRVFTMYFTASQKYSTKAQYQIPYLKGLLGVLLLGETSGTLIAIMRAKPMLWVQEDAILIFYVICYSLLYFDVYYCYGNIIFNTVLCNPYISTFLEYFGEIRRCIAICNRIEVFYLLYQNSSSFFFFFGMPILAGCIQSSIATLLTPSYELFWICNEWKQNDKSIWVTIDWKIYFGIYTSTLFTCLLQFQIPYREVLLVLLFLLQKYLFTNQKRLISKASQSNLLSQTLQKQQ